MALLVISTKMQVSGGMKEGAVKGENGMFQSFINRVYSKIEWFSSNLNSKEEKHVKRYRHPRASHIENMLS